MLEGDTTQGDGLNVLFHHYPKQTLYDGSRVGEQVQREDGAGGEGVISRPLKCWGKNIF